MKQCNTEELYGQYRERLLSLIKSKVHDSQEAEDLLHDSFVKLQTCCDNNCECASPKSYLFRSVLNTVFDFFKKKKKEKLSFEEIMASKKWNDPIESNCDAECDLISCLNGFLKETSEENRIAYEMVDLNQNAQVQVADELGIPLPTLKSRVQRTRKFLKEKLATCCPDYLENCK